MTAFVSENLGMLASMGRMLSRRVATYHECRREFHEAAARLIEVEGEPGGMIRHRLYKIVDDLAPPPGDPGLTDAEAGFVAAIESGIIGEPLPLDDRDPVDLVKPILVGFATGLLGNGMEPDIAAEVIDVAIAAFRDASKELSS